jgi:3-methyladenine DNA glycosylase AlkD
MATATADQLGPIIVAYDPDAPRATADALRSLWLQFEAKSVAGIKAELRDRQETAGISIPALKAVGKELGKAGRKRVDDFVPLARLLWDDYGREGRVVAALLLGAMELISPQKIVPLSMELCRTCITWEDADRLAMDALEPVVRKRPEQWLGALEPWLADTNKWVRRAGVTAAGRLPMVHPAYTARCLELIEHLLLDRDGEVKPAVSFAIRICARGDIGLVRDFLARHVPPQDAAAGWVLCDAIRSMTKSFLPEFEPLLPRYEEWATSPALSAQDRRSVESALKALRGIR